jgi:PAS domain S-box-containing protein
MGTSRPTDTCVSAGISLAEGKQAELELIYKSAPVGLALLDLELHFVRCNQRLADIDGCSIEDHLGRTIRDMVPAAADTVKPIFLRVIETGEPSLENEIETEVPSDPGHLHSFLASYFPLKDTSGEVVAVSAVVHDLTALKESESLRQDVEEQFGAFMDHSPAVIYMKDSQFRHLYGNQTILDLLGLTQDKFVGTTSRDHFSPEIAEQIERADDEVLSTRSPVHVADFPMVLNGETAWFKEIKFPIKASSGEILIGGVATDITALKKTELELTDALVFMETVAELSGTFINLRPGEVDGRIDEGLARVGELMRVDRCFINQFSEDKTRFRVTHIWSSEKVGPQEGVFDMVINEMAPWYTGTLLAGNAVLFSSVDNLPAEAASEREYCDREGIKATASVPLLIGGEVIGNFGFDDLQGEREWSEVFVQKLWTLSQLFANALARQRTEVELQSAFAEIKKLKDGVEAENLYLREEIELKHGHDEIIGQGDGVRAVLRQVEQVAETDSTVLIAGETGVGKELVARAIHRLSPRRDGPLVTVNCAALPATLIEAELFGREKGAYTGALTKQVGRFEVAHRSTIFLDEVGDLPFELQAKLLRVLQEGEIQRLGSSNAFHVDVRVLAASKHDLEEAVREGRFREDLFYRLSVFPITLPPLRERKEDIPQLVWHFVRQYSEKMGTSIEHVPKKSMDTLVSYSWPGNIRQLQNIIEQALIASDGPNLDIQIPATFTSGTAVSTALEDVERDHILRILDESGWRIRGTRGAAELLELKPTTLEFRMKKLGIRRRE